MTDTDPPVTPLKAHPPVERARPQRWAQIDARDDQPLIATLGPATPAPPPPKDKKGKQAAAKAKQESMRRARQHQQAQMETGRPTKSRSMEKCSKCGSVFAEHECAMGGELA